MRRPKSRTPIPLADWRNIPITLKPPVLGEEKAQCGVTAGFVNCGDDPLECAENVMVAGKWRHSVCITCFRKRWPRRPISPHQVPHYRRVWEQCCFCEIKHNDGIHMR